MGPAIRRRYQIDVCRRVLITSSSGIWNLVRTTECFYRGLAFGAEWSREDVTQCIVWKPYQYDIFTRNRNRIEFIGLLSNDSWEALTNDTYYYRESILRKGWRPVRLCFHRRRREEFQFGMGEWRRRIFLLIVAKINIGASDPGSYREGDYNYNAM